MASSDSGHGITRPRGRRFEGDPDERSGERPSLRDGEQRQRPWDHAPMWERFEGDQRRAVEERRATRCEQRLRPPDPAPARSVRVCAIASNDRVNGSARVRGRGSGRRADGRSRERPSCTMASRDSGKRDHSPTWENVRNGGGRRAARGGAATEAPGAAGDGNRRGRRVGPAFRRRAGDCSRGRAFRRRRQSQQVAR